MQEFFGRHAEALGFRDVRLHTMYSEVRLEDVCTETMFSRRIKLQIPLCSAAMDTVTESEMAKDMAMLGGIGVIHKNFPSAEAQAKEVARVKHFLSGKVATPKTVSPDDTMQMVINRCREKGHTFRSFPVLDSGGKVIGVITSGTFKFCSDVSKRVGEKMEKPFTAPCHITPEEAFALMERNKKGVLPLVDKEGCLQGMYVYSDVRRDRGGESKVFSTDAEGRLRVAAAIGTNPEDIALRMELLCQEGVDAVVIDTAHGYSRGVARALQQIRNDSHYSHIDVVAGNVSTYDGAAFLADLGADAVKIGQGPGSICTTRIIAGVGCPQVTAIFEAAKALRNSPVPLIADGGIEYSGDITIALAVGADCVMIGNLFAGTEQAPGEVFLSDGASWKYYRGMGSQAAMAQHQASRDRYNQSDDGKLVPEGVEGRVPFRGDVKDMVNQLMGGLRSGMGYVGAKNFARLQEKARLIKTSPGGMAEAHVHGVSMIKNPPNYGLY